MSGMQRRKGVVGERELAAKLRQLGLSKARRGQQHSGSPESPDIKGAIEGVHIECKRVEKLNIHEAMRQSAEDAGDNVPCVMHRRNRGEWMVTMSLDDLPEFTLAWVRAVADDVGKPREWQDLYGKGSE